MPVPVTIPFGPVDAVTPEANLVGARGATLGVRVREVADLIPDPSRPSGQPATGYAVPAPPVLVDTVADRVAAFDHPSGEGFYSAVRPAGSQVQGARLGRGALFLTTEAADGTAGTVQRVSPQGAVSVLQPAVPPRSAYTLASTVPVEPGDGLMPGRLGVRTAYAYRDGSLGPATAPDVLTVQQATTLPYTVTTGGAVGATSIGISSTSANPSVEFARWLAASDVDPVTGLVVVLVYDGTRFIRTIGVRATSVSPTAAQIDFDVPLAEAIVAGWTLRFGERVDVRVTRAATSPLPADARGLALLLTRPLTRDGTDDADGLFASAYYSAGQLGPDAGATLMLDADALAGPLYAEGHVGQHGLRARRVAETAGRLLFGGVAFDLVRPSLGHVTISGTYEFVVRVTVQAESGPIYRWSEPELDEAGMGLVGYPHYPDARAEAFDVYARAAGSSGPFRWSARLQLTPALTQNAAYADFPALPIPLAGASGEEAPDAAGRAAQNAVLDDDPGRVLLTGFARPYELLAERLSSPAPAGQSCMGFAAFGGALSTGQFGEYPVVAFYGRSVFAAAFSDTGEITRWRPVEQERGAVGPNAFAAHGGGIYYLATDGLYGLSAAGGVSARLSAPVQRLSGARALGAVLTPSAASCVGVYDDGTRLEVWVGSADNGDPNGDAGGTWVYSLGASTQETPRWGRLSRQRTFFLPASAPDVGLYGLDGDDLHAETDTAAERGLAFSLVTAGVESAGGAVAKIARLSAVTDLSCPVALALYEDVPTDTVPGERPQAGETPVFSGVLAPDERFEMRLGLRSRRASVRLASGAAAGSDTAPRVGDRLISLTMATGGPVRGRRATLPGT